VKDGPNKTPHDSAFPRQTGMRQGDWRQEDAASKRLTDWQLEILVAKKPKRTERGGGKRKQGSLVRGEGQKEL